MVLIKNRIIIKVLKSTPVHASYHQKYISSGGASIFRCHVAKFEGTECIVIAQRWAAEGDVLRGTARSWVRRMMAPATTKVRDETRNFPPQDQILSFTHLHGNIFFFINKINIPVFYFLFFYYLFFITVFFIFFIIIFVVVPSPFPARAGG
jgi:hypothetical protein